MVSEKLGRPELAKLRSFALAWGIILLGFSLAGVAIEPKSSVELPGLSLIFSRPTLIPYVLLLATIYGILRFYYYGMLVTKSPYSARQDLLNRLVSHFKLENGLSYTQTRSFGTYFGPQNFELGPQRPWMQKRGRQKGESESANEMPGFWVVERGSNGIPIMPEEGLKFKKDLEAYFPSFGGASVVTRWNYEANEDPLKVRLFVRIPNFCRISALLEDVDYTIPIWFNIVAISAFVWSRTSI